MIRKYFIRSVDESVVLALKFHPRRKEATIGGRGFMLVDARYIAKNYFNVEVSKRKEIWTQKNKARVIFTMDEKKFDECLNGLQEVGYTIQPVKSHGRLMR